MLLRGSATVDRTSHFRPFRHFSRNFNVQRASSVIDLSSRVSYARSRERVRACARRACMITAAARQAALAPRPSSLRIYSYVCCCVTGCLPVHLSTCVFILVLSSGHAGSSRLAPKRVACAASPRGSIPEIHAALAAIRSFPCLPRLTIVLSRFVFSADF